MSQSDVLIVIPARMGSTRFPGKPLAKIAGVSMIRRTAGVALKSGYSFVVATDSSEISDHCLSFKIPCILTDSALRSGSDRSLAAAKLYSPKSNIIVNLQGDAPFTPVTYLHKIVKTIIKEKVDIVTPCVNLNWTALDILRHNKKQTPFSGTTLAIDQNGFAIWFSKHVFPAIRNEAELRNKSNLSPIFRHIGLYAYRKSALEKFVNCPESKYEKVEGLEQLRALENDIKIRVVEVEPAKIEVSGIDTIEDLKRAEALLKDYSNEL